jgi:hypothetical protein
MGSLCQTRLSTRTWLKSCQALAREKMKLRVFMVSRTVDGFDVIER